MTRLCIQSRKHNTQCVWIWSHSIAHNNTKGLFVSVQMSVILCRMCFIFKTFNAQHIVCACVCVCLFVYDCVAKHRQSFNAAKNPIRVMVCEQMIFFAINEFLRREVYCAETHQNVKVNIVRVYVVPVCSLRDCLCVLFLCLNCLLSSMLCDLSADIRTHTEMNVNISFHLSNCIFLLLFSKCQQSHNISLMFLVFQLICVYSLKFLVFQYIFVLRRHLNERSQ